MLLNNQWLKEEIRAIRTYFDMNGNENILKLMGFSKSSAKGEIYSYKCLH